VLDTTYGILQNAITAFTPLLTKVYEDEFLNAMKGDWSLIASSTGSDGFLDRPFGYVTIRSGGTLADFRGYEIANDSIPIQKNTAIEFNNVLMENLIYQKAELGLYYDANHYIIALFDEATPDTAWHIKTKNGALSDDNVSVVGAYSSTTECERHSDVATLKVTPDTAGFKPRGYGKILGTSGACAGFDENWAEITVIDANHISYANVGADVVTPQASTAGWQIPAIDLKITYDGMKATLEQNGTMVASVGGSGEVADGYNMKPYFKTTVSTGGSSPMDLDIDRIVIYGDRK
jgi:hypothetical protein